MVKIILHRIISVGDLTSFLPETWTTITHDDELRRPPLSVKRPSALKAIAFSVAGFEDRSLPAFEDGLEEVVVYRVVVA